MYSLCFSRPSPRIERRTQQRPQCLVVDDDPVCRTVLQAQLRTLGLDAMAAATGRDALEMIERLAPAIVLIDTCLSDGDGDGYGLAQRIRQRDLERPLEPAARNRRLVALSAQAGSVHRARCLQSGMDQVLNKPVSLPVLAWALGLNPSAATDAPLAAVPPSLRELYRTSCLTDLAAFRQAVRHEDRPRARAYAHRIRGASQMVGAHTVAGIASVLERGHTDRHLDAGVQARALSWLHRILDGSCDAFDAPDVPARRCDAD